MGDLTRVGKASHSSRSSANDVSKRFTSMSGIQMCGAISNAGQVMNEAIEVDPDDEAWLKADRVSPHATP